MINQKIGIKEYEYWVILKIRNMKYSADIAKGLIPKRIRVTNEEKCCLDELRSKGKAKIREGTFIKDDTGVIFSRQFSLSASDELESVGKHGEYRECDEFIEGGTGEESEEHFQSKSIICDEKQKNEFKNINYGNIYDLKKKNSELNRLLENKQEELYKLEEILQLRQESSNVEIYKIETNNKEQKIPTGNSETVTISLFSDLHCDEVVKPESVMFKNEYNRDIAKNRVNNYFINLVKLVTHHQKNYTIKRHIIGMLGDLIGGFIHEEMRQTNSMTPLEGLSFAKSIIISGFKYLQENLNVETIDVVCVVGNHARTTDKLPYNNLTETSYEYFLYKDLQSMCELIGLSKFNFIIPKSSLAIINIFGKNYGFVHGNGFRFLGGIGGLYVPLLKYYSRLNSTFNIDRLFFGHYHTTIDIRQAVGNGSFKGYDPFAMSKALDYEVPQQSMVLLNEKRGFTNFQPIYLD